jgi:hypothetical protein
MMSRAHDARMDSFWVELLVAATRRHALSENDKNDLWERGSACIRYLESKKFDGVLCWLTGKETARFDLYKKVYSVQVAHLNAVLSSLDAAHIPVILHKGVEFTESLFNSVPICLHGDLDILVPRESAKQVLEILDEMGFLSAYFDTKNGTLLPNDEARGKLEGGHHHLGPLAIAVDLDLSAEQMATIGKWQRPIWTDLCRSVCAVIFDVATGLDSRIGFDDIRSGAVTKFGNLGTALSMSLENRVFYTLSYIGWLLSVRRRFRDGAKLAEAFVLITQNLSRIDWAEVRRLVDVHGTVGGFLPLLEFICRACDVSRPAAFSDRLPDTPRSRNVYAAISAMIGGFSHPASSSSMVEPG